MSEPIITNTIATVAGKPATGILITVNTTVLWLIGFITPYLAFIALSLGIAATIYSINNSRKESKLKDLEIQLKEKQLHAKIKPLHK